mgnify:FL=1
MRDAYALVIGIDQYERDGIPTLPHCVDDGLAAVSWLRSIEVPDNRILLHLSPSTGRNVNAGGIAVHGCDHRSIVQSINSLKKAKADQLFVILSGHGLYAISKSVFLPSDYGVDEITSNNFWLDEYLRYFMSWDFRRQYIIYNACKEPIATIGRVPPVMARGPEAHPDSYKPAAGNALTVCHAAAPDEKAWSGDAGGTLVSELLDALAPEKLSSMDPLDPLQSAIIYDWDTGTREVDLKEIFDQAVAPRFALRAAAVKNPQTPFCQRLGVAELTNRSPIIDLPQDTYLPVVVKTDPPEAKQAIALLTLRSPVPTRQLVLPGLGKPINLPMRCFGPTGATVWTSFLTEPMSEWRKRRSPAPTQLVGDTVEITLELERTDPPPLSTDEPPDASFTPVPQGSWSSCGITPDAFNIRASGTGGASYSLPGPAYDSLLSGPFAPSAPQAGVIFERHEFGPNIRPDPAVPDAASAARSHALDWLHALRSTYAGNGLEIYLSPIGDDFDRPATNLRFVLPEGGARRLGGHLAGTPLVSIELIGFPERTRRMSLTDIEGHPTEYLEAGFYRVRVDLPWGDWACSISVGLSDGVAECTLPKRIGVEPLRNLAAFGEASERARIRQSTAAAGKSFNVIVRTGKQRFAILGGGIELILNQDVSGFRIEPQSDAAVPEWDAAFSTGRASAIETSRIRELLGDGAAEAFRTLAERDLMLLACAYAAFGRDEGVLTVEALDAMHGALRDAPDASLLRLATGASAGADVLHRFADSSLVPLLRWGVPIMQTLLHKHNFAVPDWTRHLTFTSAWTTIDEAGIKSLEIDDRKANRPRVWTQTVDLDERPSAPVIRTRQTRSSTLAGIALRSGAAVAYPSSIAALVRGVDILADAVKVTLGPKGRTVVIEKSFSAPRITKDGVTVAKEIELADKFENMGAQMVREVASKTNDIAGDGTTTATVLAQAIVREGAKYVAAGMNPMDLKRGIDLATQAAVKDIQSRARKVSTSEEIAQVGTISANGDKDIGEMIAHAMQKVGNEGVITVEEAKTAETELDVVEGMQFDRGYLSPYFITNAEKMIAELEDPYILIHEKKLSSLQAMLPVLEAVVQTGKPLVIVAEDIEGEALATLVVNKLRGGLKVAAVKAPGFGDRRKAMLEDIAILTQGQMIAEDLGIKLENVTLPMLGRAKRVRIEKENTTIIDGAGEKSEIEARVQQIKAQIEETTSDYDREKLQERLAKLAGGVAVIRVGGATEVEVKEKKDRVDDALHATRAAVKEGIVPGGGTALLRAKKAVAALSSDNADVQAGIKIVLKALEAPIRQIAQNAGVEGSIVVGKITDNTGSETFGFNAESGEYVDMIEAGIIDPAKVVLTALQDAASIAGILVTVGAIIVGEVSPKQSDNGHRAMEASTRAPDEIVM